MPKGTCVTWKGKYGFIEEEESQKQYFLHFTDLKILDDGFRALSVGQEVAFEIVDDGDKPRAGNVTGPDGEDLPPGPLPERDNRQGYGGGRGNGGYYRDRDGEGSGYRGRGGYRDDRRGGFRGRGRGGYDDRREGGRGGYDDRREGGRGGYDDRREGGRGGYDDRREGGRGGYNRGYEDHHEGGGNHTTFDD